MAEPDLAMVAARFGDALHARGVPVGAERCERFARAVAVTGAGTTRQLYWCALATLVCDPAHVPVLDRLFTQVFHHPADHELNVMIGDSSGHQVHDQQLPGSDGRETTAGRLALPGGLAAAASPEAEQQPPRSPYPAVAAATERLASRDFAELTEQELAELVVAMRRLRLALPVRRSRRQVTGRRGPALDLRATLRTAGRTAGHPVRLRRRRLRRRPRRLVVLCDISGSMAPYARAVLQLLCCAAGGADAEVFSFATRLTRLTRIMSRASPAAALAQAGHAAPDWSGGTRIGASLKRFNDAYGARGVARGAVLLIVSDGWDTGDPAEVERQMARLSRLAYRIVWANPRTASPGFQPLAGGMAAAWPYCDRVVSAHHLQALGELLDVLGGEEQHGRRAGGRRA